MKRPISIVILLSIIMLCACTDRFFEDGASKMIVGDTAACRLALTVGDFEVVGGAATRATDEEKKASPAEKEIDNIWVFQYDTEGNQIIKPKYYKSSNCKNDDGSWNVILYVYASTIYVVANVNDSTWASTESDFDNISKLKAKSIPSPYPIQVGKGDGFVEADSVRIPMSGSLNVTADSFKSDITVDVVRMYAKLIVKAQMLADMALTAMEVNNIPYTCRIESRSDNPYQEEAASYTSVDFITRAYNTSKDSKTATASGDSLTQDYVIYVPENIQGVNTKYISEDKGGTTLKGRDYSYDDGCPSQALTVTYRLNIKKDNSNAIVSSTALMFPGANNTNNFNVNRNYVYKVTANFSDKRYFFPTPSSNCFVVEPGETLTFWPYYRVETGGGYEFRKYLDPTVESKRIDKLKIIWQDYDVIGDNTNGDLVSISSDASGYTEYKDIIENFTIDVKTKHEGNALVAAYNSKGEIIWSWHIWVTSLNPDNVGNAIRYTTYEWDNDGMHADRARIPGYQVMPCNLGATALVNSSVNGIIDGKAYGMLYQWGRKDPFPPLLLTTDTHKVEYTNENAGKHYGNSNELVYKTSNDDPTYCFYTRLGSSLTDAVGFSVGHPTTFIAGTNDLRLNNSESGTESVFSYDFYFNKGDWCPVDESDNKLWGGLEPDDDTSVMKHTEVDKVRIYDNYGSEKSIFDPCPTGWRVPPGDLWLGFTSTGQNPKSLNQINSSDPTGYNHGMYMYLEGWKTGQTSYFPTPGSRTGDGMGIRRGMCGNYHNASTGKIWAERWGTKQWIDNVNILHIHSGSSGLFNILENQFVMYHVKSCAGPIRCVRDKK